MSYTAIEVKLRDGRVIPRGSELPPKSGEGLLVILSEASKDDTLEAESGWQHALSEIRKRQSPRGHTPRTDEIVAQQLQLERESWD